MGEDLELAKVALLEIFLDDMLLFMDRTHASNFKCEGERRKISLNNSLQ